MNLFRRKNKVLDLTKNYEKHQEKLNQIKEEMKEQESSSSTPLGSAFNMFGPASTEPSTEEYQDLSQNMDEKRRKLTKRIMNMTSKIEDLSNQIYHLEQRIEVLERKTDSNRY